jgi:glucose-1-phosphate adenylyltransferase
MEDITIISYPGTDNNSLLSLSGSRSKYMLPFGGKFRIVDFTISNSISSGSKRTIIYNDYKDDLENYVEKYGPFEGMRIPPIQVVSREYSNIRFCYNMIRDCNTGYYVIYNGDNPSIIDFSALIKNFRSKKKKAVLYKLKFDRRATMAYSILVTDQKRLLKAIRTAIDEGRESPNIFEMIINIMLNKGIRVGVFKARYWPLKNIPDYYYSNIEILRNPELFSLLYKGSVIETKIQTSGIARIGMNARIVNSFIFDGCEINGDVSNSIVFPGVSIGEKTIIRDSIILPFTRIGSHSKIAKTVIDENMSGDLQHLNIGNNCRIGSDDEKIKNSDFPKSIFKSITLIGKDCDIPDGSAIGGACYVSSGLGREYFFKRKYLDDGLSLLE